MKLEDFDLRNKEFRDYLIECINYYCHYCAGISCNNIISLLEKEKITDDNIIKIMFLFQSTDNLFSFGNLLFDYKIAKIGLSRKNKFIEIIKKEFPEFEMNNELNSHVQLFDIINRAGINISSIEKVKLFKKLVDIFLDEV